MGGNLLYREHIILVKKDERLEGKFVCYWVGGNRFNKLRETTDFIDRSLAKVKSILSSMADL